MEFNISYGEVGQQIKSYLEAVWRKACESERCINAEKSPRIRLVETADHTVVWRLYYTVGNIYRLFEAKFAINRSAYDLSAEMGISLLTSLTHEVANRQV